jgi:GTPase
MQEHKSGFVNIIGNPNVGKSTLMNLLVGEKLSIITNKSQTTRHRIMGIVNNENYQIIFSDTPGIIKPKYKLQESMVKFVSVALTDADIILYVTDVEETKEKNIEYIDRVNKTDAHILLIINKIDLSSQEKIEKLVEEWKVLIPKAEIYPVSALHKFNIENINNRILDLLPVCPPYFEKDQLTDRPARFFVSEIIREKILQNYDKEIPYSVEIVIESFKEDFNIIRISALIYVLRESQKKIVIGKGGSSLKKVGTEARIDIEAFFEKKVFLQLFVKINKEWRDNEFKLKNFGYE